MNKTRVVEIAELPKTKLSEKHFRMSEQELPDPSDGQVLVQNLIISIDAANRAWMQGPTYRSEIKSGQIMDGYGVGKIIKSASQKWQVGDIVEGDVGWSELTLKKAESVLPTLNHKPVSDLLSVFGIAGKTAWHGLFGVGKPKPGETLLVSAAAGSVGTLVGQMAKLHGCQVIGIAGSDEKCQWVQEELNFDAAINYRSEANLIKAIASQCPKGVDIYFDNVGGKVLESALFLMNNGGRVVCCGAVSQYDTDQQLSPRGIPGLLVVKRLRMEGFVVMDFAKDDDQCIAQIKGWVDQGRLKNPVDIVKGLENAPKALIGLLGGDNKGKRMVQISEA